MDKPDAKSKGEHPLARWVEQLEPECVMWLMERGYCTKDKQATRITEKGNRWLFELEQTTHLWLRQVGLLKGGNDVQNLSNNG